MKRLLIMVAVVVAVVASTSMGGVKTASAFNPQPEPPAAISEWFNSMFPVSESLTGRAGKFVDPSKPKANARGGAAGSVR